MDNIYIQIDNTSIIIDKARILREYIKLATRKQYILYKSTKNQIYKETLNLNHLIDLIDTYKQVLTKHNNYI